MSSSSIFLVLPWASGPLTECAKHHCCPVCLLEALDCSPSFPVFLPSPHALGLMDSCSQSCQFQLSLWLRLQSDRTHKSLWQGMDPGRDKGRRAEAAQGCSEADRSALSRFSEASLLCQRRATAARSSVECGAVRNRLYVKQVGVRLEILKSGWIKTGEMVHQEYCRGPRHPYWQVTATCNSCSRGSDAPFWPSQAPHARGAHNRTQAHKDKIR